MLLWIWMMTLITLIQANQPAWAYDHTSVEDAVKKGCNQPGEIAAKDISTNGHSKYHDDVVATCMLSLTNNIISRTLPSGTMVYCGKPPHCHSKSWQDYTWGTEPTIKIIIPSNNARYKSPANITLFATTTATNSTINSISFYSGNTRIGGCTSGLSLCAMNWQNVKGGTYAIKALVSIGSTYPGSIVSNTINIIVDSTKTYNPTASWNGQPCYAVLLFGGNRTNNQTRISDTDTSNPTNYLENSNASLFPNGGAYTGTGTTPGFSYTAPSADMVRCISTPPTPAP